VNTLELRVDVTKSADLGEPAHLAVSVTLPDPAALPARPVVCFAKPGGGYSRGYYTSDLPGPAKGAQAEWHARQGWIMVSVDHLGVGDSSLHEQTKLDYVRLSATAHEAEAEVLRRLAEGTLADGFPPIADPLRLGIGQSMGGLMTIIQQGQFHDYDGIAVLGYSAIHTIARAAPGMPENIQPWFGRDTLLQDPVRILNATVLARGEEEIGATVRPANQGSRMAWGFFYDDVDPEIVRRDLAHFDRLNFHDSKAHEGHERQPWTSFTFPAPVAVSSVTPGICAVEAAAVRVPVLAAFGEHDVARHPLDEPRAYLSAPSVDVFVCPRMGHMHNFAGTRELFWQRIATWADWVRAATEAGISGAGL